MILKRGLNLHIKVEGLDFGHSNIHVNFQFPKLTLTTWVTCEYCLLWQMLIVVEDLIPTCNTHI